MFLRMQQLHAQRFVALPQANELILYYWAEVVKATNSTPDMISGEKCAAVDIARSELICLEQTHWTLCILSDCWCKV